MNMYTFTNSPSTALLQAAHTTARIIFIMKSVEQSSPPQQKENQGTDLSRRQFLKQVATGAVLLTVGTSEVANAEIIKYGGWKGQTYYGKDGKFAGCIMVSGEPKGDIEGYPLKIVATKNNIILEVTLDTPDPGIFVDPKHLPDKDFKVTLRTMNNDDIFGDGADYDGADYNARLVSREYDHEGKRVSKVAIAMGTKDPLIEKMKDAKNLLFYYPTELNLPLGKAKEVINLRHEGKGLLETNDTYGAIKTVLSCVDKNAPK
jgi:hypothetical protein